MEDLYGDLENYQFENVVSELRNENQELKCKLEEYSSTLANLQKDFDKLSAEYKKLELNYSSLLKTARAEIERKSQLITNLNIEKDKLVIESIQNRGKLPNRKINTIANKQQIAKELPKCVDLAREGHVAAIINTPENVPVPLNHDRKDKHDKTKFSRSPTPLHDHDVKEREQSFKKADHYMCREQNEMKIKQDKADDCNNAAIGSKISKIRNRRKSMPLTNRGDFKFSSDEDENNTAKDRFRRNSPMRDDRILTDKIYHDKYRNGRNDNERKDFEFTRAGDNYGSNSYSTRDMCRKSNSWYRESDRHRSRDNREKFDSNQRFRRRYSPERQYATQAEYYNKYREPNDKTHRFENIRHRTLVSPPPERYDQHRRSRDFDGQRFPHEGVHLMKHKIHHAIEEPTCKRFRSESFNRQPEQSLHDRDGEGHTNLASKSLGLSYLCLRSPDHINLENNLPVHLIKEIKSTSDTKLDDPRLTSKKYKVHNTYTDNIMLSTVGGRDVDIKVIDTNTWNTNNGTHIYEVPTLLREKPPISEDIVNDIYMGIDNPMSNMSIESGEICLEEEMGSVSKNKSIMALNPGDIDNISGNTNVQNTEQIEVNKKEATANNMLQTSPTSLAKNYRIPKITRTNTLNLSEDDNIYSKRNKSNKRDNTKHCHKKKKEQEKKLLPEAKSLKMFSSTCDIGENKRKKTMEKKHRIKSPEKAMKSARDTVEGDLELSDETCDYIEVPEQTSYDKGNHSQKLGDTNKNVAIQGIAKDFNIAAPEKSDYINKGHGVFKHEMKTICETKHFNISNKVDNVQSKESLKKTDKQHKSKDIKNKLCDLFGDTSSLITLDDLGVVEPTAPKENLNLYTPLFDNTQDAVDLNVEEMEEVQTRSMKLNHDEAEPLLKNENLGLPLEVSSEKKVNTKDKIPCNKVNQKYNSNTQSCSSLQQIFENVNGEPKDNAVVKTVIISRGIQNNCQSVDLTYDGGNEKQLSTFQRKTNDNVTNCPSLLSLKALATSTPYKPQTESSLSVPEISFNSNNTPVTQDPGNISSNSEKICKTTQSNLDIPDVRIIVKRRRKNKGAP